MRLHNTSNMRALIVLLTLLGAFQAHAATLYGLDDGAQLLSIEPTTFKTTPIGKPNPEQLQAQGLATIDGKNGIYYFIGYNDRNSSVNLIGLSLKDGSIVFSVQLPFAEDFFIGVGQLCNLDTNTGDVIIVGSLDDGGPAHVMRVNVQTGLIVNIGVLEDVDVGDFSAFDSRHSVLYIDVWNDETKEDWIYGMDTSTGEIVNKLQNVDFELESIDYDPVTDMFYGFGINTTKDPDSRRTFVSLDQHTGNFTQVSVVPKYWIINGSITTLDAKLRRLSAFLSPYGDGENFDLVSVDVDTGKVLYTSRACDDYCPWSIEYGL